MKRSQINAILKNSIEFIDKMGFKLPAFARFSPEQWAQKGSEFDEIRSCMLGWDVTDYGHGDFDKTGLVLFTLRNGASSGPFSLKPYAEKLMISQEGQYSPMHFHWSKMEDIINRGGGDLMVELYNRGENDSLADTPVTVISDGRRYQVPAGEVICLTPGESITLTQGQYHAFWAKPGSGPVLIGEVSMVNDDNTDNRFYEPQGRFPEIIEDEPPVFLLCNEYPPAK